MQLPTEDQLLELINFINVLPVQYASKGDPVSSTLERYDVDPDALAHIAAGMCHDIIQRLGMFIQDEEFRTNFINEMPDISTAQDVLELGIKTSIVQMFCFASEYQKRFVLPDLLSELRVPDDISSIGGMNGE